MKCRKKIVPDNSAILKEQTKSVVGKNPEHGSQQ